MRVLEAANRFTDPLAFTGLDIFCRGALHLWSARGDGKARRVIDLEISFPSLSKPRASRIPQRSRCACATATARLFSPSRAGSSHRPAHQVAALSDRA